MNGHCIILSVAEKPSVAKELAKVIPRNCVANRRQGSVHVVTISYKYRLINVFTLFSVFLGYSPYNHIYDVENCAFKNHFASMKITSVTGHMMEVDFDDAHKGNW